MKKVVLITARSGFPNGYGAASIIRKYSKGFIKSGYNVRVMLIRPSEYTSSGTIMNKDIKGQYEEVEYEYMSKTCFTSSNIFVRYWRYFIALLRTLMYLIYNRKGIEKVFFYSPDYLLSTFLIQSTCRLIDVKIIGIKTESSFSDRQRTKRPFWIMKEKLLYRLFSSMIVITEYLKEQLHRFGYDNKNISVIPIIVDEEMYKEVSCKEKEESLIYMGTLNYENELKSLIEMFRIVQSKYPQIKLRVIGGFVSSELEKKIKNQVNRLNIKNSIIWHGKIPATDIPKILIRGGVMVLPRSAGEYSKGGFPIKLGEYLLSGAPTVVTRTGDIEEYLIDKENAFLVKPDDPVLFANEVISVLDNFEKSLLVGEKGKKMAEIEFGAKNICKKMLEC